MDNKLLGPEIQKICQENAPIDRSLLDFLLAFHDRASRFRPNTRQVAHDKVLTREMIVDFFSAGVCGAVPDELPVLPKKKIVSIGSQLDRNKKLIGGFEYVNEIILDEIWSLQNVEREFFDVDQDNIVRRYGDVTDEDIDLGRYLDRIVDGLGTEKQGAPLYSWKFLGDYFHRLRNSRSIGVFNDPDSFDHSNAVSMAHIDVKFHVRCLTYFAPPRPFQLERVENILGFDDKETEEFFQGVFKLYQDDRPFLIEESKRSNSEGEGPLRLADTIGDFIFLIGKSNEPCVHCLISVDLDGECLVWLPVWGRVGIRLRVTEAATNHYLSDWITDKYGYHEYKNRPKYKEPSYKGVAGRIDLVHSALRYELVHLAA